MFNLIKDVLSKGKATAAAGTPITVLIPKRNRLKAWLEKIVYTAGSTAHVLTIMKSLGFARLAANAAAGQNKVVLFTDPSIGNTGALSAGDYVVVEDNNGVSTLYTISATSGAVPALTVTLSANLPTAANGQPANMQGNTNLNLAKRLWYFGTAAATGHINLDTTASVTNTLQGDTDSGLGGSDNREEPLIVYSPNGTAAGTFEQVNAIYLETGTSV